MRVGKRLSAIVTKALALVVALVMAVVLAACGGSESADVPPDQAVAPGTPSEVQEDDSGNAPEDTTLSLTVPRMERVAEASIPDTNGYDEEALKNYAGIHLEGTGFPWQDEANVYMAGHRLGFPGTDSFLAFYDLDALQQGDQVYVVDAEGREYTYEVFQTLEVDPTDLYVTEPMEGRNILTLQTCTLPDYARRLVVQAELKETQA